MRSGVRVALDLGTRRIGVARCDREAIMAVPDRTIDAGDPTWLAQVTALVREHGAMELIVGNPVSLRGRAESASQSARERATLLAQVMGELPVRMVDERLTTAGAMRQLQASGKNSKQARQFIDAQAAVGILEFALEYERRTGQPAGELL
ncbi:MAG: Holliday junction resolvase RuvX [Candidatus Nanopelagicales bacterium]